MEMKAFGAADRTDLESIFRAIDFGGIVFHLLSLAQNLQC